MHSTRPPRGAHPGRGAGLAVLVAGVLLSAAAPDAGAPAPAARPLTDVTLLSFQATWCGGCKRLEAGKVVERLQAEVPGLKVERVDVDQRRELVERYGVEYTPTLLLVDAEGFPLGKVRIELDDPGATVARGVKLVRRATGR